MKQSLNQVIIDAAMGAAIVIVSVALAFGFVKKYPVAHECGSDFGDNSVAAMNYAYITGGVSRFIIGGEPVYCFGRINGDDVTCYGTNPME